MEENRGTPVMKGGGQRGKLERGKRGKKRGFMCWRIDMTMRRINYFLILIIN